MDSVTYTNFRKELAGHLDKVNKDRTPLLVTRQNASPVVVLPLDEFNSYEATAHLLSSRKNADRLDAAIKELKEGRGKERELIEE